MSDESRTRKVRTTIQPDVDLEVGPEEYLDLKRQGLLVEDDKKEPRKAAPNSKES